MKASCLDNFLDLKSNQIPIVTGQHMLLVHIIHYLCVSNLFSCSSYYVDDDDDGCLFIALFSAVEQTHCRSRFLACACFQVVTTYSLPRSSNVCSLFSHALACMFFLSVH